MHVYMDSASACVASVMMVLRGFVCACVVAMHAHMVQARCVVVLVPSWLSTALVIDHTDKLQVNHTTAVCFPGLQSRICLKEFKGSKHKR